MDGRNERLIMSRIVANTSGSDEPPQYFLITPKLLPALTHMEHSHVMIHFVFNGPGIFNLPFIAYRKVPGDKMTGGVI